LGANADCQSVANNLKSEDTFHTVAVASFIGAGVAGAAGVALHFALGKPKAQESSLRVVPVVGKTNGVAATWTW
jgi:precorrin-3B methylase